MFDESLFSFHSDVKSRVCRGCIDDVVSAVDDSEKKAFLERWERENPFFPFIHSFFRSEISRLSDLDRSQFLVEELSEDEENKGASGTKPPLEKRPSFLRRTFSRKLKVSAVFFSRK